MKTFIYKVISLFMKRPVNSAFIAIISLMLTITLVEVILTQLSTKAQIVKSHRWIFTPSGKVHGCQQLDEKTIYRPTPNNVSDICWKTESHGFRITPSQSDNATQKILFVGDSFTFSDGVGDEETYPFYTQQLFDEEKLSVKVLNSGIPGYSMDQQIVFLENYVFNNFRPNIVVWNINENDEYDNDQACLFTVENGKLKEHPGYMNTIYLLGSLYQHTPVFIRELKTFSLLFQLVPDRWTIGCSRDTQTDRVNRTLKTKLLLQRILNLSKIYRFKLVFTYIQSQFVYTTNPPAWYIDDMQSQIATIRSVGVEPVVVSDEIFKIFNERRLIAELSNKVSTANVLGTLINNLSSELFLADPAQEFGSKHMNAEGNKAFAQAIYPHLLPFVQNLLLK